MRFRPGGCAGNGAGPTRIRARLCGQSQGPACVRELMTIATRGQAAPPTFCRPPPVAAITVFRWPPGPKIRALAGRLRRAQTFLRTLGIEVASSREGRAGTRMISVSTSAEPTVSTVSGLRHQASEAATEACRIEHGLTKSGRCLLWRTSSAGWGCFEAMLTVLTQTPPFVSGNSAAFKSGRDHDLVAWGRSLRFLNMSGQRRQGRL